MKNLRYIVISCTITISEIYQGDVDTIVKEMYRSIRSHQPTQIEDIYIVDIRDEPVLSAIQYFMEKVH